MNLDSMSLSRIGLHDQLNMALAKIKHCIHTAHIVAVRISQLCRTMSITKNMDIPRSRWTCLDQQNTVSQLVPNLPWSALYTTCRVDRAYIILRMLTNALSTLTCLCSILSNQRANLLAQNNNIYEWIFSYLSQCVNKIIIGLKMN